MREAGHQLGFTALEICDIKLWSCIISNAIKEQFSHSQKRLLTENNKQQIEIIQNLGLDPFNLTITPYRTYDVQWITNTK